MYKTPLEYKKEDIEEIMYKPILIDTDSKNSNEEKTISCVIIGCTLASNPPYLPAYLKIEKSDGEIESISLFEIKRFRDPI